VVAAGDALLSPTVTRRLLADMAKTASTPELAAQLGTLTDRETEVLREWPRSQQRRVGRAPCRGRSTVKTHVSRVLMKLGLRDRVQAVAFAYESGLIQPGGD